MSGKLTLTLSRPASPALQRVLAATRATPPAAAPAPIPVREEAPNEEQDASL